MLVVLCCLLPLPVLREVQQEELPRGLEEGCGLLQRPAARNFLQPCECCECALEFWQWLRWKLPQFWQQRCETLLRQFLKFVCWWY